MTLKNEEKKETLTLKEVGKYIFFIFLSLAVGSCYNYFQKAGESANEIKIVNTAVANEIKTVNSRIDKEILLVNKEFELSRTHRETQEKKIEELEAKTKKLQESRDDLSKFYVTRPEFNRIIDEQKKLLEKMDGKLDKLTDRIYDK